MKSFGFGRGGGSSKGRVGVFQETITKNPIFDHKDSSNTNTTSSFSSSSSCCSSVVQFPHHPVLAATSSSVSSLYPSWNPSACACFYDESDHRERDWEVLNRKIERWDWESVDGDGDEEEEEDDGGERMRNGFYGKHVFGQVPSVDEVEAAVSAIQQFPSAESEVDWIEPSLHMCLPRTWQANGGEQVYSTFHMLQTDPSVQRMVIALSTDRAVWNAVMNNEVVQELRESFDTAENDEPGFSGDGHDSRKSILRRVLEKTKTKVMELIEKITALMNVSSFQNQEKDTESGAYYGLDDKLRSSLLLSVLVLLVVVIIRFQRA